MSHGELAYVVRPRVHKGGFVYKLIVQLTSFPQFISIFTKTHCSSSRPWILISENTPVP